MKRHVSLSVLFSLVLAAATAPAADFSGWNNYIQLTFNGYNRAETLTNFPALIVLGSNIISFAYNEFLSGTNADLRFTDGTQTNELNYQVDSWNTNGLSYAWVQVPQLTNNASIYMYWGKTGQTQPAYTTNGVVWNNNGFGGVWHLTEDPGLNLMLDSATPVANNLTSTSLRLSGNGKIGPCLSFDGTTHNIYWTTPQQGEVDPTNAFTLSAWINRNAVGAAHSVIEEYDWDAGGLYGTYGLRVTSGNQLTGWIIKGQNVQNNSITGATTLNNGAWYHVSITFDSVAQKLKLYVNGVSDATPVNTTFVPPVSTKTIKIGASGDTGAANMFNGLIDEPRIDTVARSSNWLWACYMNQGSYSQFVTNGAVGLTLPPNGLANQPATNVTATSAWFNGYLNSTGTSPTTVSVYWGTNDGVTTAANWGNTNTIGLVNAGSFSANITTLTANRMYFYRYYAVNSNGGIWAPASEPLITGPITLQATVTAASQAGPTNAIFTVTRPAWATGAAQVVNYTTGGTAVNGTNYAALTGTTNIAAGATNATIVVTPINNYSYSGKGSLTAILTLASGGYLIGTPNSGTATIGYASATLPTNGLALWLKADAITNVTNGGIVASWPDSGPVAYGVTAGSGKEPTYQTGVSGFNNLPVVTFNGTNQTMTVPSFVAGVPMTIFVIGRFPVDHWFNIEQSTNANNGSAAGFYIGGNNYNYGALVNRYPPINATVYANFSSGAGQAWMGSGYGPGLTDYRYNYNGSSRYDNYWSAWSNGTQLAATRGDYTATPPSGSVTDTLYIMSRNQTNLWGNGSIAELMIYNAGLSDSDRQLVEGLLAWKYGMQSLLSSDHPWKNSNPALAPKGYGSKLTIY